MFLTVLFSLTRTGVYAERCSIISSGTFSIFFPVKTEYTPRLLNTVQTYQRVMKEGRLLQIDFTTLVDYLHLLKACSLILARIERKALLYLAAAVSDFYIPSDKMVILN